MSSNHVLLETINLTQNATSVIFDNIPQTGYTDLKIVVSARTTQTGSSSVGDISMRFNNNSSSVYSYRGLTGAGSTGSSGFSLANENMFTYIAFGSGNDATANAFGSTEIYIPNYMSLNAKSINVDTASETNANVTLMRLLAGVWNPSPQAAINRIDLMAFSTHSFLAGSTFSLYGVAAFGTTPTIAPRATGGNIVANDGTYWYHAFLNSGTFTPQTPLSCDVLVVAGGGAGGGQNAGGGGAGGLLAFASQSLSATNYACTIGAGGTSVYQGSTTNGNNSQFGSLTASVGGGAGGFFWGGGSGTAQAGGSGGGAAGIPGNNLNGGAASPSGQGNAGGNTTTGVNSYAGAGGGGAGAAGNNSVASEVGGAGGIGATSSLINGIGAATNTGQLSSGNYYFAGGGGGGGGTTPGAGGLGGGGAGRDGAVAFAGTANTGGGGGGARGAHAGGNGGSGIVIIRYPMV